MLAAAVATGILATPDGGSTSFALSTLGRSRCSTGTQEWIFLFFALAFLVKMPAFPLHGWMPGRLPRTRRRRSLVVLSGVLSKVGAYGFLRIALPLFPDAAVHFQELLLVIALASILYGSVMAFTQTRRRSSSATPRSHSSASSRSASSRSPIEGAQGAVLQMVNHGLVVVPLFFIIALLAARAGGTDDLRRMGGLALRAPVLAALFLIVALATLAMPGLGELHGRVPDPDRRPEGEDRVRDRRERRASSLAAVYMIRLYQRSMHNRIAAERDSRDLTVGRRSGARADGGGDHVLGALPAVRAEALRAERSDNERRDPVVGRRSAMNAAQRPPHRLRGPLAAHSR